MDFAEIHRRFPAAQDYMGAIYILYRDYGTASHTQLAQWLGVSAPAVTQAIGRLKRLGLVRQQRYQNVSLTDTGREFAVRILRRHYLLERLLVGVLEYPWDKADEEAKRLQSEVSDDFEAFLVERLHDPQTCPHGNPMPGVPVEAKLLAAPQLSEAPAGERLIILRITEEGEQLPEMLAFCDTHGIHPGARFRIEAVGKENLVLQPISSTSGEGVGATIELPLDKAHHIRYGELPET